MANRDNEINLKLTADDQASKVIDSVADDLDRLEDDVTVEVDVDADTRDAETRIERFERELDDLQNPDAIELRVEFRQQVIEGEIRKALRQLERLEDPVEIEVTQGNLERAQQDLKDLAEFADRKYEIDVEVDPKRTAQQAAGDFDRMNNAAEGFQSGIPALRGFTDELGETAAKAGVAGQAMSDLGDFALISGERFGLSSGLATGLGSALGGAGLAAVILGTAIPAIKELIGEQEIQLATAEELLSVQEALAEGDRRRAAEQLAEAYTDIIAAGREFGLDAGDVIERITADTYGWGQAARDAGADNEAAWDNFTSAVETARGEFGSARQQFDDTREAADAIALALGDNVAGGAEDALVAIRKTEEGLILLEAAQQRLGDDATPEELVDEYQNIVDEVDEFGRSALEAGREADRGLSTAETAADDAADAVKNLRDSTDDWTGSLGRLDDELATIKLDEKFKAARTEADLTRAEIIELTQDVADYATEVLDVPEQIVSQIVAEVDPQSLADVETILERLRQPRTIDYTVRVRDAQGRPITGGTPNDPVIAVPTSAGIGTGQAVPAGLTVNVRTDAQMRQVDRAISRWRRLNGSA